MPSKNTIARSGEIGRSVDSSMVWQIVGAFPPLNEPRQFHPTRPVDRDSRCDDPVPTSHTDSPA